MRHRPLCPPGYVPGRQAFRKARTLEPHLEWCLREAKYPTCSIYLIRDRRFLALYPLLTKVSLTLSMPGWVSRLLNQEDCACLANFPHSSRGYPRACLHSRPMIVNTPIRPLTPLAGLVIVAHRPHHSNLPHLLHVHRLDYQQRHIPISITQY